MIRMMQLFQLLPLINCLHKLKPPDFTNPFAFKMILKDSENSPCLICSQFHIRTIILKTFGSQKLYQSVQVQAYGQSKLILAPMCSSNVITHYAVSFPD